MRAFLAVELDDALRSAIARAQQDLAAQIADDVHGRVRISWPSPASLHLTLVFLGDIDERAIEPLRAAIHDASRQFRAVRVPIDRLGAFPRGGAPSVLWAGPSDAWMSSDEMTQLHAMHNAMANVCVSFGVPRDHRAFAPHLTVARIKSDERAVGRALAKREALTRPINAGALAIESIVLMKSDTRPSGAVYTKLWEVQIDA